MQSYVNNFQRSARNLPRTSWSTIAPTHVPHTHSHHHGKKIPDRQDPKQGGGGDRPLAAFNESATPVPGYRRAKHHLKPCKLQSLSRPRTLRRATPKMPIGTTLKPQNLNIFDFRPAFARFFRIFARLFFDFFFASIFDFSSIWGSILASFWDRFYSF